MARKQSVRPKAWQARGLTGQRVGKAAGWQARGLEGQIAGRPAVIQARGLADKRDCRQRPGRSAGW
jgi:hypothetical protein